MAKNAIAKLWNLLLRSDGTRYSKPPIVPPTLAVAVNSTTQITVTASGASSALGSITGYLWYRNGALISPTPSASPLVDTGLTPATLYAYSAIAVDSANNRSALSAEYAATTNASSDTTAPSVPGSVAASVLSSAALRVVWLPSVDTGGSGLLGYRVERSLDGSSSWALVGTPSGTTFDDLGLSASTRYYYRVSATDAAGNISGASVVVSAVTLVAGAWQLEPGHFEPAMMPLEVTFPKQGLAGAIYRPTVQHPGVPMDFPIGVFGGAPPFYMVLKPGAPAGMTLASIHGQPNHHRLIWPNPIAGSYALEVEVRDQDGSIASSAWTLRCDPADWVVLDSEFGNDANPGTLLQPKKTPAGIYGQNKHDTTYSNKGVLCRGGAYSTSGMPTELGAGDSGLKPRVALLGTNKPNIWCLYPGESATFDFSTAGVFHYGSESLVRIWWDGFDLRNPSTVGGEKAIAFVGSSSDTGFFNLGAADNATPVDSNNTFIFSAIDSTNGQRLLVSHCRPTSVRRIFCELYGVNKVTFQYNSATGFTAGSRLYYAKSDVENQCIWFNYTYGVNDTTVGNAEGNAFIMIDNYINGSTGKTGGNAFVTRNSIKVRYCGFLCGQQANALQKVVEAFNTWHCEYIMHRLAAGPGPVAHKNSIIKHTGVRPNGIYDDAPGFPITYSNMLYATSGVIDDTTLALIGADRAAWLGLRGAEIA